MLPIIICDDDPYNYGFSQAYLERAIGWVLMQRLSVLRQMSVCSL